MTLKKRFNSSKIEKIIMWTAGTMFFTMLTILLTTVFGAKVF